MKKILSLILVFVISSVPAYAGTEGINAEITDINNDVITVSGPAQKDEFITVTVINPGKSASDTNFAADKTNEDVYQYFNIVLSKEGKFSCDIKISPRDTEKGGGEYTVNATYKDKKVSIPFTFYCYDKKLEYVQKIGVADGTKIAEAVPLWAEAFSINKNPLYLSEDISDIADSISLLKKSVVLETPADASKLLNMAIVLSGFNSGNEKIIVNGTLEYADIIEVQSLKQYEEYLKCITPDGKNALHKQLLSGGYKSISEITERFKELVLLYAVTDNVAMGSGHVKEMLEKYYDDYSDAGFRLSLLNNITNVNGVFNKLANSQAKSISQLADEFNTLIGEETGEKNTPTKKYSGGGGGGGSPASFTGQVEEKVNTEPVSVFGDVKTDAWYFRPVFVLQKSGIIAGRGNGVFAPEAFVTRAEFVKMLCMAVKGEETARGEIFSDVEKDGWYNEYINAASKREIIFGDGDLFRPNDFITRQDAAVIIHRALSKAGISFSEQKSFDDMDTAAEYARIAICELAGKEIISGTGENIFCPTENITRAQTAQMIYASLAAFGGEKE